jgi:predicted chitinase
MRFEDIVARPEADVEDDGSEEIIQSFVNFASSRLGIKERPNIVLIRNPKHAVKRKSFGGYMGGSIEVMIGNRHVMDVMRTLAHELVHYKQDSDGVLRPDSGRDGSEHENEANAKAAVIMRLWGKMNPELFDRAAILAESWQRDNQLDEGLASTLAGAALATGLAFGSGAQAKSLPNHGYPGPVQIVQTVKAGDTVFSIAKKYGVTPQELAKFNKLDKNFTIKVGDEIAIPKKGAAQTPTPSKQPVAKTAPAAKPAAQPKQSATPANPATSKPTVSPNKTMTGTMHEAVLKSEALKAGITGVELAAFLAQCHHETLDFQRMTEIGGSLDFRKYDPKFAPKKARALGNVKPGDGARYKGRGYIQLTGRYNYKRAGEALDLPLEAKPELVERPDIAAKVAVWFWKQRVQPKVDNYNDVRAVTTPINPGLNGLADRKQIFADYKDFYNLKPRNI